ncbi:hypothetical protein, partial [Bartonella sp. AA78NXGY]|uniref:hypothetical protein n=1 Tax=Bartonella sp. AA78NXGY TaxID=3243437 RepID=UPI0035D0443F
MTLKNIIIYSNKSNIFRNLQSDFKSSIFSSPKSKNTTQNQLPSLIVACQRVLYILTLGFVPIYFFSKSFKDVLKG